MDQPQKSPSLEAAQAKLKKLQETWATISDADKLVAFQEAAHKIQDLEAHVVACKKVLSIGSELVQWLPNAADNTFQSGSKAAEMQDSIVLVVLAWRSFLEKNV